MDVAYMKNEVYINEATLRSFLLVLQICRRQNRQNFADEILSESRQDVDFERRLVIWIEL